MDNMEIDINENTNMEDYFIASLDANEICTEDSHLNMEEELRIKSLCSALEETYMRFKCTNDEDIDLIFERFGAYAPSSPNESHIGVPFPKTWY